MALSDTGSLFATGMADSSIKVFWLSQSGLEHSLGMGENNPFVEKDPSQILSCPYTLTSTVGLKMQLYADQYEISGAAANNQ